MFITNSYHLPANAAFHRYCSQNKSTHRNGRICFCNPRNIGPPSSSLADMSDSHFENRLCMRLHAEPSKGCKLQYSYRNSIHTSTRSTSRAGNHQYHDLWTLLHRSCTLGWKRNYRTCGTSLCSWYIFTGYYKCILSERRLFKVLYRRYMFG